MADGDYIIIVDEHDNPIGSKLRKQITPSDIYRVAALWVTNSQGDILLAQRGLHKTHNPGQWGPAVAGTVEVGETYDSNIVKETFEEIGIPNIKPTKTAKLRIKDEYNYFCQGYTAVIDKPVGAFVIEADAVEQVKWFTRAELTHELTLHPEMFTPSMSRVFKTT